MQREKEKVAAKMREKQAAGIFLDASPWNITDVFIFQPTQGKPPKLALILRRSNWVDFRFQGAGLDVLLGLA